MAIAVATPTTAPFSPVRLDTAARPAATRTRAFVRPTGRASMSVNSRPGSPGFASSRDALTRAIFEAHAAIAQNPLETRGGARHRARVGCVLGARVGGGPAGVARDRQCVEPGGSARARRAT